MRRCGHTETASLAIRRAEGRSKNISDAVTLNTEHTAYELEYGEKVK